VLTFENWFLWPSEATEVIEALDYVTTILFPFFNCLLGDESINDPETVVEIGGTPTGPCCPRHLESIMFAGECSGEICVQYWLTLVAGRERVTVPGLVSDPYST
jgi:hypothetical protein